MTTFMFYVLLLAICAAVGDVFKDNRAVNGILNAICFMIIFDGIFIGAIKRAILIPLISYAGS